MITAQNLSKSFPSSTGAVPALHDVTLDVGPGTLYGVLGAPGAGKSTLTQLLALRDRPDRGAVLFDGVNTAGLSGRALREVRGSVALVAGPDELHPERTAAGNIAAPLEQAGMDAPKRRDRVGAMLDLVGLTERAAQQPGQLSPGQRRRVSVARALTIRPSVLIADDPTAGLDAEEHGPVLTVLDRARAELGTTVLLATPDAAVVRRVCEDVALLEQGVVTDNGPVLDVISEADGDVANALLPAIDTPRAAETGYDQVVDVVLIGFAAVGALLPEASGRFGVDLAVIGGGLTRFGDTPVARFRLGVRGERASSALAWVSEHGAVVTHAQRGPRSVAA